MKCVLQSRRLSLELCLQTLHGIKVIKLFFQLHIFLGTFVSKYLWQERCFIPFLNLPFLANFYKITGMSGTYYYYYYYDFWQTYHLGLGHLHLCQVIFSAALKLTNLQLIYIVTINVTIIYRVNFQKLVVVPRVRCSLKSFGSSDGEEVYISSCRRGDDRLLNDVVFL